MKNYPRQFKQNILFILIALTVIFEILFQISFIDKLIIANIEQFFHKNLQDPAKWIGVIRHTTALVIFTLFVIYFLDYIDFGVSIKNEMSAIASELKGKYLNQKSLSLFIFCAILLYIVYFKIIAANFLYDDDIFRNYGGKRSWIGFSRYISEFLSIVLHNNLKLNDIAPLTQFISIIVSALTILILSISLTDSINIKNILALSIIFIAPFYVENFSFRFDSPYMAFSLLFPAVPFLFKNQAKSFCFVSIIGLLLTCISYQAGLSLYILATIYLFAKDFFKNTLSKKSFLFVFCAVASFIAALLMFKLFFMNVIPDDPDSNYSSTIQISSFFRNSVTYIKSSFLQNGGLVTKVLFVASILLLIIQFVKYAKQKKLFSFLFILAIILTSYILSFGPYLVLSKPVFCARAFLGFNTLMAFILLANLNFNSLRTSKLALTVTILFVYSSAVIMFTFGNCLENQKEYQNFRVQMIIRDISENIEKGEDVSVSVKGTLDYCEKNRIALKNYPFFKRFNLITRLPVEGGSWNDELFNGYNLKCECDDKELTEDFKMIKNTSYHTLYRNGKDFIVVLK